MFSVELYVYRECDLSKTLARACPPTLPPIKHPRVYLITCAKKKDTVEEFETTKKKKHQTKNIYMFLCVCVVGERGTCAETQTKNKRTFLSP